MSEGSGCNCESLRQRISELERQLAEQIERAEYSDRAVKDLEPRAAFGDQCYQDRCENAYVEASAVKLLERQLADCRARVAELEGPQTTSGDGYYTIPKAQYEMRQLAEARKDADATRRRLKTISKTWGEWEERVPDPDLLAQYPLCKNVWRVFCNNRFHVQIYKVQSPWGEVLQVTVGRHGDLGVPTWAELQRVKDELIGEQRTAIEFFPARANLVDQAPLFHMWVLPEGIELPFGLHLATAWGHR